MTNNDIISQLHHKLPNINWKSARRKWKIINDDEHKTLFSSRSIFPLIFSRRGRHKSQTHSLSPPLMLLGWLPSIPVAPLRDWFDAYRTRKRSNETRKHSATVIAFDTFTNRFVNRLEIAFLSTTIQWSVSKALVTSHSPLPSRLSQFMCKSLSRVQKTKP